MCVLEVWQSTTETRVCKKNRLTLSTLGKIASDTARKVPISTASAAKKKQQEYLDYFRLNTVCRPAEIARDRLNCSMYTYTLTLQVAQRGWLQLCNTAHGSANAASQLHQDVDIWWDNVFKILRFSYPISKCTPHVSYYISRNAKYMHMSNSRLRIPIFVAPPVCDLSFVKCSGQFLTQGESRCESPKWFPFPTQSTSSNSARWSLALLSWRFCSHNNSRTVWH